MNKTTTSLSAKELTHNWHILDASGQPLGRFISNLSKYLIGKHKPGYTPNLDNGDFVVVINAKNIVLTGNKLLSKTYYRHSGIPGGLHAINASDLLKKSPAKMLERAVKNMLPKNKLQDIRLRRLKIYDGPDHPHTAQIKGSK
jgi:large subunit ribosomal protein L13